MSSKNTIFVGNDLSINRPMTKIRVQGSNGQWYVVDMLFDTGNDVTLFRKDVAQRLGFQTDRCSQDLNVSGISGQNQKFCFHQVNIRIGENEPITISAGMDTSGTLHDCLLGRRDLLKKYGVTITDKGLRFEPLELGQRGSANRTVSRRVMR